MNDFKLFLYVALFQLGSLWAFYWIEECIRRNSEYIGGCLIGFLDNICCVIGPILSFIIGLACLAFYLLFFFALFFGKRQKKEEAGEKQSEQISAIPPTPEVPSTPAPDSTPPSKPLEIAKEIFNQWRQGNKETASPVTPPKENQDTPPPAPINPPVQPMLPVSETPAPATPPTEQPPTPTPNTRITIDIPPKIEATAKAAKVLWEAFRKKKPDTDEKGK